MEIWRPSARVKPGQAARSVQGRKEDFVYKAFLGGLEGRELQFSLGPEMREQAALGKAEPLGQRADRQPFQTNFARVGDSMVEDQCTSLGAFAHS